MNKSSFNVAYLDSVRGVAAMLVFVHHFLLAFYSAYYTFDPAASHLGGWEIIFGKSVLSVFTNGNFWVHVFFVLSGFVLSRRYFQTGDIEILISAFHRRFFRLYIPVAFAIMLSYMMLRCGFFYNSRAAEITHSEWWLGTMWDPTVRINRLFSCLAYATMFRGDNFFDTSMWTISPELYGSMFVYAFLLFTHFTRHRIFLLFIAFFYFYSFGYTMYACFVLGMSLGPVEKWMEHNYSRKISFLAGVSLTLALVLGSFPSNGSKAGTLFEHLGHVLLEYTNWYHAIGAYLLVLSFVIAPGLQKAANVAVLRFIGRISFSLYLLHALIIGSYSSWLFLHLAPFVGYHLAVAIVFLTSLPLVLILSQMMTTYIDDKGVAFSRLLYERVFSRRHRLENQQI
jgi:peptidoglycan/LPS O-acetylase OafA/YrhL